MTSKYRKGFLPDTPLYKGIQAADEASEGQPEVKVCVACRGTAFRIVRIRYKDGTTRDCLVCKRCHP